MSSISGVSSQSNAWANAQRSQMQAKMFSKVDTDSSGGVNPTELQTLFTDISQKTGKTLDAQELFTTMDSNADGSLTNDELVTGMKSVMPPPPSTLEFAQNRSKGTGQDDLFSKVDANSDGSVDETEMTAFTEKMKTETGKDSPSSFSQLDKDSDGKLTQSEFDAGKPADGPQDTSGAQGGGGPGGVQGGPPPEGGPGGAAPASGASQTESTTYDPPDTNEDGQVSELERLAGALKELANSNDASSTSDSTSESLLKLAQQVYEQVAAGTTDKNTSTLDATA